MPKLPDPTSEQIDLLRGVEVAAQDRDAADRAYFAAIYAAADSGLTATQIAPYVGRTYQAVQSILKNRKP